MLLLRQPNAATLAEVFRTAAQAEFNYLAGEATVDSPPAGFFRNDTEVRLGRDEDCWLRAVGLFKGWVRLGWCDFLSLASEPTKGEIVVARARHWGFWSLHPSRVIATDRQPRRLSYTIRTLAGHSEMGEERFTLEWLPSGEVRFAIRSYSRPATIAGWLALPYVRHLQRRFGREAAHFMQTG